MAQEQLVRDAVRMLWDPVKLLVPAALVAFLLVSGVVSLRILRRFPRFLHKPEMEWGAKWAWLAVLSIVALALAITHLSLTGTPYVISSWLFGKSVLDIGFLSAAALRYQFSAVFIAPQALRLRLKGQQFDIDAFSAWLGKQERWWSRRWRVRLLECGIVALVLLPDAYFILGVTYPLDVGFDVTVRALRVSDAVCAVVTRDLRSGRLLNVSAYPPHKAYSFAPDDADWGTPRAVRASLTRIAAAAMGSKQADASVTGEYLLFLRVSKETARPEAQAILRRAEQILTERGDQHHWRITAYNRDSHLSVSSSYLPLASRSAP